MQVAALVLGILGGLFGLVVGLFGYSVGGIAGAGGVRGAGGMQLLSIAIPVASFVGGGMAIAQPAIGGVLMLLSAGAMGLLFGFNFFTAISIVLNVVGGALALSASSQEAPVEGASGDATTTSSVARNKQQFSYDAKKWNALVEFDPDIAAAAAGLEPFGKIYVAELAQKYLAINDKQYLKAITSKIAARAEEEFTALSEEERLDSLGRNVAYIFVTGRGYAVVLKDGSVVSIAGTSFEILPSLGAYRQKFKDHSSVWDEILSVEKKRKFFHEFSPILRHVNGS